VTAPPEPGDEQVGNCPRDALMQMHARFCDAVERAIAKRRRARDRKQLRRR
jgi:hypothetical protein